MKLLFLVLLSVLSYHCCPGYPIEGEISDDVLIENRTSTEYWLDASNETASNDSSSLDMRGFFMKIFDNFKDKMNEAKDCTNMLKFIAFSFARQISEDILTENRTSIEYWFNASNETALKDSSPQDMHGFGKKVVTKVKEGIKTVKDKVKDGYNKVKDKIKGIKDKIGSKGGSGGGSGGGYYKDKYDRDYNRDKYDRDYNRDKYDRDYNRKDTNRIGGGYSDSFATWVGVGVGIFLVISLGAIIFFKAKEVLEGKS